MNGFRLVDLFAAPFLRLFYRTAIRPGHSLHLATYHDPAIEPFPPHSPSFT